MKYFILPLILICCLNSCVTTTHIHYSDPNYLSSNEFSSYEEITENNKIDVETTENDSINISSGKYNTDDYYDYSFSSRIKRFHRPIFYSGYYGGFYTDYYWYNTDPFYWGTSIYNGYNWCSPYYSYYSYSPYYYTPYYYGNYYSFWYGHHYYHLPNNTYSIQNNNYNSYIDGPRRSLTSYGQTIRGIKSPTTLLSNTIKKNSSIKIRTVKNENVKDREATNFQNNSNFKTTKNNHFNTEKNSTNRNNVYRNNRKNNTDYNSNRRNQKSTLGNKSSENRSIKNNKNRSLKPRK